MLRVSVSFHGPQRPSGQAASNYLYLTLCITHREAERTGHSTDARVSPLGSGLRVGAVRVIRVGAGPFESMRAIRRALRESGARCVRDGRPSRMCGTAVRVACAGRASELHIA